MIPSQIIPFGDHKIHAFRVDGEPWDWVDVDDVAAAVEVSREVLLTYLDDKGRGLRTGNYPRGFTAAKIEQFDDGDKFRPCIPQPIAATFWVHMATIESTKAKSMIASGLAELMLRKVDGAIREGRPQ